MRPRGPKIWRQYLYSLGVAYLFAFCFTFLAPLPWPLRIQVAFVSGFVFGTLFFAVGSLIPRARFRSFWLTCLARSLIVTGVMAGGMVCVLPYGISLDPRFKGEPPWSPRVLETFAQVGPDAMLKWIPIGLLMSFAVNALHQISRKLGPGVILNWLTGKYHTPREEERIFMFLDLKNSTPLGEKLGNISFSKLVQDFFHDLTDPVVETGGEVSHYIGDEAVLSWKPRKGLENANCIRCFFLMQEAIKGRSEQYLTRYGIIPEFKAGVHIGPVIATEVGDIKSEIVFHGDVLNTTARIIGKCTELDSDLLVSGALQERLVLPDGLQARSLGMHQLKGKEHEIEIIAVSRAGENRMRGNSSHMIPASE